MSDTPDHIIEVPRDVRPTEAGLLARIEQLEEALAEARRDTLSVSEAAELLTMRTMVFRELCHPPHDAVPDLWSAIAKLEAMVLKPKSSSPEGETE